MKNFITKKDKAVGIRFVSPAEAGLGLVSLDSENTKEYNHNHKTDCNVHLVSFYKKGLNLAVGGRLPTARPLNIILARNHKSTFLKFKKLSLIAISALFLSTNFAFGANGTEDFFYNRGYEMGYQAGFNKGVEQTFKEAKKVLEKYGSQLKAYEIGKYLIKNQKLTYPQVWQEMDGDGRVVLRITPSQIQKELNIDGLFSSFAEIPQIEQMPLDRLELTTAERNSVNLSIRDSNINEMPQNPSSAINQQTLRIKKSSKNLDILKRANVVFSDEDESYNVLFFTDTEKRDFCRQFEICGR